MQTVASRDGTRIAFWQSGKGPPLLLVGGDSPQREKSNASGVADALPDARVVSLPDQQHVAMYSAPEVFAREVVQFLEGPDAH